MFTTKNLLILIVRNTIIAFLVVFVTIVAIFFLRNKIEDITNIISLNQRLEAEFKKKVELFSVLNRNAEIVGNNETLIDNAFIPSNNISEFINILDKLASDNKIIQNYSFGSPTPSMNEGPYSISSISYNTNVNANVTTFLKYIKDFENLPYFTKIEGLKISSQDVIGWKGVSTISLQSTLFTKDVK